MFMDKNKEKIIIMALGLFLSGIIGFYVGRYYEQNTMRKRFRMFNQNSSGRNTKQSSGSPDSFRRPNMEFGGPGMRMEMRP